MEKKLYRNEHDKIIAGVGSGLADFFQIDVTTIRVLLVLFTFLMPGSGIVIYIVIWAVAPVNLDPNKRFSKFNKFYPDQPFHADPMSAADSQFSKFTEPTQPNYWNDAKNFNSSTSNGQKSRVIIGSVLISLGVFFLLKKLAVIPYWISLYKFWPVLIIALGIALIVNRKRKQEWKEFIKNSNDETSTPFAEATTEAEQKKDNSTNH